MARPLRLEYPGALYHVTTRGNAKDDIFIDDVDRRIFLGLLADEVMQQGWLCYAYCLMNNHYHLLFETPEANLCRGMQRLNGRYTKGLITGTKEWDMCSRAGTKPFWWKKNPIFRN